MSRKKHDSLNVCFCTVRKMFDSTFFFSPPFMEMHRINNNKNNNSGGSTRFSTTNSAALHISTLCDVLLHPNHSLNVRLALFFLFLHICRVRITYFCWCVFFLVFRVIGFPENKNPWNCFCGCLPPYVCMRTEIELHTIQSLAHPRSLSLSLSLHPLGDIIFRVPDKCSHRTPKWFS